MEFGVYVRGAQTYPKMLELAQAAENLGYYGVFVNDHVEGLSGDRSEPYWEAWTLMTGIGVETKKIKVGQITLFNSMRNPALLAKMAATLDQMTDGRYELILGAGWSEPEYLGYDLMEKGRGMPTAAERVSRLKEAVDILKGMMHNEVFSYDGKYWKLKEAMNVPQPIQKPFRISVGARQPRMIKIAAKYADGINASGNLQNIARILGYYHKNLDELGKTVDDVFISGFAPSVYLMKNEAEYEKTLQTWKERGTDIKVAREYDFIGTPEVLIEKWRRAMDLGMKMSIINVRPSKTISENTEMLALFKDKVASQL
ncbi:MAG: LLM class flavin-dependent oxidoreductase [Candidatus Bathyarchaeota archaeon]|nr:LLM class flavin-dependent oxidoreductase [Candidatus Bathyarchaeota archaeon]